MDHRMMSEDDCHALGKELGAALTIAQQVKLLEGLRDGHHQLRSEQQTGSDAFLCPDLFLGRVIEMLGLRGLPRAKREPMGQQMQG